MDFIPDDSIIKQENNTEDGDDYLEFCFDVHVKVENDIEWPIQSVLAPENNENYKARINYEEFEQNESLYLLPRNKESYAPNENYQENINYKEFKGNFQTCALEKYQGEVLYGDVKEEISLICMFCRKYFSDSKSLFQHNLCHLKVPLVKLKLFMCEYCPKYCKKKVDIINHIKINHLRRYSNIPITKQAHTCEICNKTYSYKAWFSHMREVHSKGKFQCHECSLIFKCKRYLTRHIIKIHFSKEYKLKQKFYRQKTVKTNCPKCPAILDSKYALTTHLRNCHSNETYTCHICKSTLKCKAYLLSHMKRVHHNDGMLHECELCGKEFKSARYVKIHIKNSHIKKEKS